MLETWDYFGSYTLCTGNQAAVKVARVNETNQVLGQYQLPLARKLLTSYFSDNDGDAVLGEDHLFVTDSRTSVAGLKLSTSSVGLNWQGDPCVGFPCPELSFAGVAAQGKVIVNQAGNSDGSSTLFGLAPGAGSCTGSGCIVPASVPNATLAGFDFSSLYFPFANEQLVFTGDNYFCLCLRVPVDLGPPARVGGAVTPPDTTAAPDPDLLPPWPQVAMESSRKALPISIKMNFRGPKTKGDLLSFKSLTPEGIVDCSEDLGPKDCSGPAADFNVADRWLLNFEGNARVDDDASNWTVAQSAGPVHISGFYINIDNNLTAFNCTLPARPDDGPRPSRVQQTAGQKSIFYIDAPGPKTHVANSNGCAVGFRPIDSMTDWVNFKVKFTNQSENYSKTVRFSVKLVVNPGRQLDFTQSIGKIGSLL